MSTPKLAALPVEQSADQLAIYRRQVRDEQESKAQRSKISEAALAKLGALREQEKSEVIVNGRFANALRSVIVTRQSLIKLIERCNPHAQASHFERRADKLAWWIAAGFMLGREIYTVGLINFFSSLSNDELAMSDAKFTALWNKCAAARWKESRESRGLIAAEKPNRRCKSGKKCLRFDKRKPAAAQGKGQYCSTNCCAADRARARRAILMLPTAPNIH